MAMDSHHPWGYRHTEGHSAVSFNPLNGKIYLDYLHYMSIIDITYL